MEIKLRKAALEDIKDAGDWLEEQRPNQGRKFEQAIERTLLRIRAFPFASALDSDGYRFTLVVKYDYFVLFNINEDYIDVFQVIHAARDRKGPRTTESQSKEFALLPLSFARQN